ncbi:shikimate dehydrogenase [Halioxenophilus aromaticivorans]|uniref:Shikimate dehydrogenase (NADP(+)) n=1 Tax=Halioxenophilus aromaticivorans TaxID=1306992 RepID=A0AAV3U8G8_9ALTE
MSDRYAVFGNPIAQSKSPDIHRLFAEQTGQNVNYQRQLVELDGFNQAVVEFFASQGRGLNITAPFKLEAFALAEHLTQRAETAGAVNTLWLNEHGQLCADNTDGVGLVDDIVRNQGWPLKDQRVLLLGAGGAVRGVLQPILQQNPAQVVVANRTAEKATALAASFAQFGPITGCGFADVDGRFDVIINGTSASLAGDLPPINTSVIHSTTACYDMMYGAEPTVFLQWAKTNGCTKLADGLGMLVGQAAESFSIWRGVKPEIKKVVKILRDQLA